MQYGRARKNGRKTAGLNATPLQPRKGESEAVAPGGCPLAEVILEARRRDHFDDLARSIAGVPERVPLVPRLETHVPGRATTV
jgi:hypothetical protein